MVIMQPLLINSPDKQEQREEVGHDICECMYLPRKYKQALSMHHLKVHFEFSILR